MECHIVIGRVLIGSVRHHLRRGFTLIELLVVMSIIATLLTIALPKYFHSVERSKENVLKSDLSIMREAIDKFYGDRGRYPESLDELVERRYLKAVPIDPITEKNDTWVLQLPEPNNPNSIMDVRSGSDKQAIDGSNFASW